MAKEITITNKDVLTVAIEMFSKLSADTMLTGATGSYTAETFVEKANKMLDSATNRKNGNASEKTKNENRNIGKQIYELMESDKTYVNANLYKLINKGKEIDDFISQSKISNVMKQGVEDGIFGVVENMGGSTGKKGYYKKSA